MRAIERVRRARASLLAAALGAALLKAILAFAAAVLLTALGDLATPLSPGFRRASLLVAALAAAAATALSLWRSRHAASLPRVALLLEERTPALQFALATALEFPASPQTAQLEHVVDAVDPAGPARAFVARGIGVPLATLLVLALALAALPGGAVGRVVRAHAGDLLARPVRRSALGSRLSPLVVRIEPPAYTALKAEALDDPSSVSALAASRVTVMGRGASLSTERPAGRLGDEVVPVSVVGDTWSMAVMMPSQPAVLRLVDRGEDRLVALDPRADAAPAVRLESPHNDTTYARPRGRIALAALASDDIGLVHAEFELMHTAGSGERFTTRRWTTGGVAPGLARTATIRAELSLDTLHLAPGDVLHVRAVAWDANTVSGPDTGASDTRTIRIADPRELDTLSLDLRGPGQLDTTALAKRIPNLPRDYIRGRLPKVVVDVDRVRLKGTDPVAAAQRTMRPAEPDVRQALLVRLDRALDLLRRGASHAADSLTVIRVEALTHARDAAEPLGRAIDALRTGRDAMPALTQARRRLERATDAEPSLPAWQGGR